MELHAKLVRSQLSIFKPFVAGLSLEVTRKGQDKLGELMTALHRREVLVRDHDFEHFQGAWVMPKDQRRTGVILYLHGGGYTCGSLEYAKGFAAALASECGVRVFCPAYRLAPEHPYPAALDDALESYQYLLQKGYEKDGMKFCLKSKVVRIDADGVVYEQDGREEKVLCDKVLLAIGRKPVADTCGVENLNLVVERGAIKVDECCRTNAVNVYAVGDCNGTSMLAHSAYRMGEVAVNTILGKKDRMRYKAIPSVLYTNPEVACVGMTEEQAKAAGIDAVTVKLPMAYAGRYVAENEGLVGIAKFVFDKKYRTLVGAHVMSNYSSEFILACAVMIEKEMTVDAIREIVYPHPSVSEIIREAAFAVKL